MGLWVIPLAVIGFAALAASVVVLLCRGMRQEIVALRRRIAELERRGVAAADGATSRTEPVGCAAARRPARRISVQDSRPAPSAGIDPQAPCAVEPTPLQDDLTLVRESRVPGVEVGAGPSR